LRLGFNTYANPRRIRSERWMEE